MVRIRMSPAQFAHQELIIEGEAFHYLSRVHRVRVGDNFEAITGQGLWGEAKITGLNDRQISARWIQKGERNLPGPAITLFQGLPKGKKFDLIIEKATELGVAQIVPVMAARSIPEPENFAARHQRWNRIAESAALQSRRATVPLVSEPVRFEPACELAAKSALGLFLWEEARQAGLKQVIDAVVAPPPAVAVWIGPEGGWSEAEARLAAQSGAQLVGLGENILRTETAGFVMLSILGFCWGGFAPTPNQGSP